jgi:hypothetical protein
VASRAPVSAEQRREMIQEAAYLRAERRGFVNGDPVTDWLDAEAEINAHFPERAAGDERRPQDRKLEQLEKPLYAANQGFHDMLLRLENLYDHVREEWHDDLDRLRQARESFEAKVDEIRELTGPAKQKCKREADRLFKAVADEMRKLDGRYPE